MVTCRWRRGLVPPWLASLLCCWRLWLWALHCSLWIRTLIGPRTSLGSTPQHSDDGSPEMDLSVKPGDLQRTRLLLLTAQEDQEELKTEGMIHHVDTNRDTSCRSVSAGCGDKQLCVSMLATAANVVFSAHSARQQNKKFWQNVCEDGVQVRTNG